MTTLEASSDVSLVELFGLLYRRRARLLSAAAIAAIVSGIIAFLVPVSYTAEAVILTPQQAQSSLSSFMGPLAGLAPAAGMSGLGLLSGLSLRNPADLYVGVLESRTIADALITKFSLKDVYQVPDYTKARKRLTRNTRIESGKDSLIRVRVDDHDAARAAKLANGYVAELAMSNSRLAFTEAGQRRLFFEAQLVKEKEALAEAEIGLRNTQQATGLVAPSGQAEALLRVGAQLHGEILSRETQLEAMKTFAADDNPRLQMVKRELGVLRSQLNQLEQGDYKPGTLELPTGRLPEASLKYIRAVRELKYHETLFEVLSRQYEAAKLDEAKSAALVQVVDRAVTPEQKSWPPRALLILIAVAATVLLSSFWILLREQTRR
ncbi:MAG TPA: Wzz/FepE/Etk N-terminal domain-containing protein [Bryobacteraceae bacterium]|nr:Wzz/FepE/Etk N-terminal domain-containing protein [Bryobacteraceae bacterium]